MTSKEFNKLKVLKRHLKKLGFGEALVAIMKCYDITVGELADNSMKDYRTIVAYRNGEVLPPKESVLQIAIGLTNVPIDIRFLLVDIAGYNLCNVHEDIVYSMLLANADSLDIETANSIIEELNKDELFSVNRVKQFKTITL